MTNEFMHMDRDDLIRALLEARAVAEMAITDEYEENGGLWYEEDEPLDPDEWCHRRLLELRQNVKDIYWQSIEDWSVLLENKD